MNDDRISLTESIAKQAEDEANSMNLAQLACDMTKEALVRAKESAQQNSTPSDTSQDSSAAKIVENFGTLVIEQVLNKVEPKAQPEEKNPFGKRESSSIEEFLRNNAASSTAQQTADAIQKLRVSPQSIQDIINSHEQAAKIGQRIANVALVEMVKAAIEAAMTNKK